MMGHEFKTDKPKYKTKSVCVQVDVSGQPQIVQE